VNPKRNILILAFILLFTAVFAACGSGEPETADVIEEDRPPVGLEDMDEEGVSAIGSERSGDIPPSPAETGSKVEVTRVASAAVVEEVIVESEPRAEAVTGVDGPAAELAVEGEEVVRSEISTGLTLEENSQLTAGEVDDNAQWDDYLLYLRNYSGAAVLRVDVSERHQIWVNDSQGNPVLGARIGIESNGQEVEVLRTHSDGRAYFFPKTLGDTQAENYTINVTVNNETETFTIPAGGSQREWFVTHPGADQVAATARLDVLFLIDATGSMADEINQLKENIRSISAQIDELPSQPDVRFGMVSYRDRGDEYVTRVTDFTPDVEQFAAVLAEVYAEGGDDYPEDLNEALSDAVHETEWRVEGTVSLIFLVADAPPHLDYGQENHYAAEMMEAAERGIKIFPIASSGLDSQGEYIFRQLAQATGGRFIFLTYGAGGAGTTGTETDFNVSDYTVSALDSLVVKIVEEELSFLSR